MVGLVWLTWMRATTQAQPEIGDGALHYLQALHSWKHPWLFLDTWAKPVFMVLAAPFAQLGFWGLTLFNSLVALGTMVAIMRMIPDRALLLRWAVPVLLMISPQYLFMVFSGMTEPLFGLLTVSAMYFLLSGRVGLGLALVSLTPLSRPECVGFIPFVAAWVILRGRWRQLPLLLLGVSVYAIFTYFVHGDLFWIVREDPYIGNSTYGHGQWTYYFDRAGDILGIPLLLLSAFAFIAWPFTWWRQRAHRTEMEDALLLAGLPVVAIWVAHSYAWWSGDAGSAGLIRVFATTVPLSVYFVLLVSSVIAADLHQWKPARFLLPLSFLLLLFPLGLKDAQKRVPLPAVMVAEQLQVDRAAEYVGMIKRPDTCIAYLYPYFGIVAHTDIWDSASAVNLGMLNWSMPGAGTQPHDLVVWDSHFGPNESAFPIKRILEDTAFTLKRVFMGSDNWQDSSTPFSVWVFERATAERHWATDSLLKVDVDGPPSWIALPAPQYNAGKLHLTGWNSGVHALAGPVGIPETNNAPLMEIEVSGKAHMREESGTWDLVLRVLNDEAEVQRQRIHLVGGSFSASFQLPGEYSAMALDLRLEYAENSLLRLEGLTVVGRRLEQVVTSGSRQ